MRHRRWIAWLAGAVVLLAAMGCSQKQPDELDLEAKASFNYLWEQTNREEGSEGYGLTRDRYPGNPKIASTAATGFALTAIPIGVENGWISREEGYDRADRTLDTLLRMEHEHGFFYHFVNIDTGKREWNSEISSIDTGLLMNGVLTAGQYFGGDVQKKSEQLYERVEWPWFGRQRQKSVLYGIFPGERVSRPLGLLCRAAVPLRAGRRFADASD
ncbi:hypothetical protein [Paenibacillus sp. FSL M8-0142]|uniref:hypothetical protein n=1 Tax=Paenibacillus sp. FSL M8-0142 TaxID=2954525 RepID=UPI00315A5B5F